MCLAVCCQDKTVGMSKDFAGIDVTKLVMAFTVIAIHSPEYLWPDDRIWPDLFEWFMRLAVPFFFITSGYLIEKKLETITEESERKTYLLERGLHIFKLWILWSLIYLPLTIWGLSHSPDTIIRKIVFSFKDLLLCGHAIYAHPLWFLYSMAIIMCVWGYWKKSKNSLVILFFSFAIISSMSHYGIFRSSDILTKITTWVLGGGLPIMGGALIRKFTNNVQSLKKVRIAGTFLCVSLSLYWLHLPYWTLFGGFGSILLALAFHPSFKINYKVIREQSMWIYYLHMWIIFIYMIIAHHIEFTMRRWLMYGVVCCTTWLLAYLLTRMSKFPRLIFLYKLVK